MVASLRQAVSLRTLSSAGVSSALEWDAATVQILLWLLAGAAMAPRAVRSVRARRERMVLVVRESKEQKSDELK